MTEYQSESSEVSDIIIKIENSLLKALKSCETLIDNQTVESIRAKIQEIQNSTTAVQTAQHFIFALINTIESLKQSLHVDVEKEDYQNLEGAMQKAQAEVRKHIRLEQQLKIYMDGLQEKIQQLQRQLKVQSNKYHQLFESTKAIDMQKRQLKKKLKEYESRVKISQEKDPRQLSHKTSKILSEPSVYENGEPSGYNAYKMYNERARMTKSKNFIEKSLNLKQQHSQQSKQKKLLQSDIDVSLGQSPAIKKRTDSEKTAELKQMTRTIQLKQNFRKQSRKLLKYSTQQRGGAVPNKRNVDNRSNSVCH